MFSSRVPGELVPNRLTRAVHRARGNGRRLLDLTVSNPTAAGIEYPASLFEAKADPALQRYEPAPLGLASARAAVAREYARHGINAPPERIVLTASTSEAYSILFKLLCEPHGDAVMSPAPSYPLFEHLTRLDGVDSLAYRLEHHGRWEVDFAALDTSWTDAVRAVLAVSPNNPTGSVLTRSEFSGLARRCGERGAALVVDEVFAEYPLNGSAATGASDLAAVPSDASCLVFRLGGLSKSAGLPQVKLAWIAIDGPTAIVDAAIARLEFICDAYLSVSTAVQIAAPRLLEGSAEVRARILERVRTNYRSLRHQAATHPSIEVLHADSGWSAVLRVGSTRSEEDLVLDLLERDGVLVHPGFFFDFPHEAFLVVSLLPEPHVFDEAARRLLDRAAV